MSFAEDFARGMQIGSEQKRLREQDAARAQQQALQNQMAQVQQQRQGEEFDINKFLHMAQLAQSQAAAQTGQVDESTTPGPGISASTGAEQQAPQSGLLPAAGGLLDFLRPAEQAPQPPPVRPIEPSPIRVTASESQRKLGLPSELSFPVVSRQENLRRAAAASNLARANKLEDFGMQRQLAKDATMQVYPREITDALGLPPGVPYDSSIISAGTSIKGQQSAAADRAAAAAARAEDKSTARQQKLDDELNKAMSGDQAKVYSIATSLPGEIGQLRKAIKADYPGFIAGVMTGVDTASARLVDSVADKVGRVRSGGAINRDEASSFRAQIVRAMDALKRDPASALAALDALEAEANSISKAIRPGPRTAAKPGTPTLNPLSRPGSKPYVLEGYDVTEVP